MAAGSRPGIIQVGPKPRQIFGKGDAIKARRLVLIDIVQSYPYSAIAGLDPRMLRIDVSEWRAGDDESGWLIMDVQRLAELEQVLALGDWQLIWSDQPIDNSDMLAAETPGVQLEDRLAELLGKNRIEGCLCSWYNNETWTVALRDWNDVNALLSKD